ncbi:MAG TPA: peptide-binding protein, partial [Pirellulales bacterium]|nr:peptide-binding protein [Pirellulales bacterium]
MQLRSVCSFGAWLVLVAILPASWQMAIAAEAESLVEPFDAPPLADLEGRVKWIDQPVLDGAELLRQRQSSEPSLATVPQALALRNDSAEANAKILNAMGRLPAHDTDVNWDATMVRHLGGDVKSTNPIMGSSSAEFEVATLVNFGLFSFDWDFKPFAAKESVVSWQSSEDHLYDKVVLRDDLLWSDGTPITAHDVEFSFLTIMNPKVPVPAMRSGTDKLRYVKAYDDRTVVFFHTEPLATNVWNINFGILPKHIYKDSVADDPTLANSAYHVKYDENPVCGGPYRVVSRERGVEVVVERRDDYHMFNGKQVRAKPYFKRVRFSVLPDPNTTLLALKTGKVDECQLNPEQWTTQTDGEDFYRVNTKARGTEWVYFYFGWNLKTPYFSDVRVRKAMSYAFDHEEMIKTLCYGLYQPCNGIYHPTAWMYPKDDPPKPYRQDLDRAEELLEQAGWTDSDGDGVLDKEVDGKTTKFEFSILCTQTPLAISICSLLKQNLEQIGVLCNVRPLEYTVLQEKELNHEFHAMMGGWGTGTDPDTADNIWVTGQGRNFVNYSNPKVDQLYEQGRREFDRQKRAALYAEIDRLIYDDQPST